MWHFILELALWLQILVANIHVTKYEKRANEIARFNGSNFVLVFLNELNVRCVIGIGMFVKIS